MVAVSSSALRASFALKNNGTVWGWGSNSVGLMCQLGNITTVPVPTQLTPDTDWKAISVGDAHVLVLKNDDTLWSWGLGTSGECGDTMPLLNYRYYPSPVVATGTWKTFDAGRNCSYGIKSDGTLWAWGRNDVNQLGDGTTINRSQPIQIGTDSDWATVQAGIYYFVSLLKTDGSLWSWGLNTVGELGNGTTTPETTAVNIPIAGCTVLGNENFTKETSKLRISPNPVATEVALQYSGTAFVNTILMYDITGKEVYKAQPFATTSISVKINVAHLPSGIYTVVLKSNATLVATGTMIKE